MGPSALHGEERNASREQAGDLSEGAASHQNPSGSLDHTGHGASNIGANVKGDGLPDHFEDAGSVWRAERSGPFLGTVVGSLRSETGRYLLRPRHNFIERQSLEGLAGDTKGTV